MQTAAYGITLIVFKCALLVVGIPFGCQCALVGLHMSHAALVRFVCEFMDYERISSQSFVLYAVHSRWYV